MGNSKERMDIVSNQNVATPRFYISLNEYLHSVGKLEVSSLGGQDVSAISRLNPTNPLTIINDDERIDFTFDNVTSLLSDNGYFAILGHNFATQSSQFSLKDPEEATSISETEIVNSTVTGNYYRTADNDGFTIVSCNYGNFIEASTGVRLAVTGSPSISSISFGNFYDMPFSPDLSVKLSHEFGGIKQTETRGGATLSNANWIKPPKWGDLEAWQLGGWNSVYSGRRVWNLSWSYVSDSDLEPRNYTGTSLDDAGNVVDGASNWFQDVLRFTMGGHLPFIFCPDTSIEYNPDTFTVPEFAICRFDMDSFERTQVANNVYNISLKIRESW